MDIQFAVNESYLFGISLMDKEHLTQFIT